VSVDLEPVASPCPKGTVARTDPQGTTSEGSNVGIILSEGGGEEDEGDGWHRRRAPLSWQDGSTP
jgi:hypothetical protein